MWFLYAMIGNILWSASDVANSVLVKRFEKNGFLFAWVQSVFDLIVLAIVAVFFDVHISVGPFLWLAMGGVIAYCGFQVYIAVLDRIDVSVMHSAWVFLAIFVSIGGYVFFAERLTPMQIAGCVLSLGGVLYLSFWHRHVSLLRTVFLLSVLGLLYSPVFLIQKKLMIDGLNPMPVFFWPVLVQKMLAFLLPWTTSFGQRNRAIWRRMTIRFSLINLIICTFTTFGCLALTLSYRDGLVSLVTVTENSQPFIAMALAALLTLIIPQYAPKELLTRESVTIKLFSFTAVTAGMILLVI